ncbi:3'-5' exonuclease [Aestuariivirga sp.]|uniref:3'-5' exonuclease n=1 Tax=Aestuariivirga sp. TaxID=2650926 RepID=UPI0039E6AEB4
MIIRGEESRCQEGSEEAGQEAREAGEITGQGRSDRVHDAPAHEPKREKPVFLIFDCETTGLPDFKKPADAPGQPRLCSIAAALVNDAGEIVQSFYSLVRPDGWLPEVIEKARGAFAVNGLSIDILTAEGRPVADVLAEYDAMVDQCTGIAAYGVAFDQKMIRAEQRIAGRPDRYGERPTFCVLTEAPKACGQSKRMKLAEALKILLDEDLPDAHNAKADLAATVKIFNHMRERGLVVFREQLSKEAAA